MSIRVVKEDQQKLHRLERRLCERDRNGMLKLQDPVPLRDIMSEADRTLTVVSESGRTATITLDGSRLVSMPNQSACIVRLYPRETDQGVNIHLKSGCVTFCSKEPLLLALRSKVSQKKTVTV